MVGLNNSNIEPADKAYASYHYSGSGLTLSSEWYQDLSLTCSGKRPVFCAASLDNNGISAGSWLTFAIKRDGSVLCSQTIVCGNSSYNNPGCLVYLDSPSAGTHTYSIYAKVGSGSDPEIAENNTTYGAYEGPNLVVFEI